MRRKLLIGATLAVAGLSLVTIAGLATPAGCVDHGPLICNVGVCSTCRGPTSSGMNRLCERCAASKGCCATCGDPLQGGVARTLARIFGD